MLFLFELNFGAVASYAAAHTILASQTFQTANMTSSHTAYVFASKPFLALIPPETSLDSTDSDAGGLRT